MSTMCIEDGPSLPLVGDVSGIAELQGLCSVLDLHDALLHSLLRRLDGLDLE